MGGDGVYLGDDGVLHVPLYRLAGDEIPGHLHHLGHLVDQGNALGLGGKHVVVAVRWDGLQQRPGACHCQLCVAEHDKRADVELVADLTQGQIPLQAGNLHCVRHLAPP